MTIITPRVLLVDDCLKDRETYRRYLLREKQRKYRILEVSTGKEALLLCRQQFPDAIATDYLLPDMDGLEFLNHLKTQFGQTNLPVIILTGRGNEQIAVQAMKGGAADYLVKKSTTPLNFIKAVENVLEKNRLTKQLGEGEGRFQATFNQAHEELERRVQERTTELQRANQELEITLEELQVFEEELRQQNEELAISRQAIELERQRYQNLFEFAPDGYLVTDSWGTIREANRTAATLLSTQQQRLIGKPLIVFIAEPERKAFRTRLAQLQSVQDWEVYLQPRRGSPFPAMVAVSSIHDEQGQQVGWRWLLRDISIRKQMEQRLQAAHDELEKRVEERTASLEQANRLLQQEIGERQRAEVEISRRERQFSTLVENSPDVIFRLDCNLRHIYISPQVERESDIPTEQFLGKTGRELGLPADACDLFEAACHEAIATGEVTRVEYSIADKQYVSRLIPESGEDGTVESLMGMTEDISDRKRREANTAFLAEITEAFSYLLSADEIIQTVGAKLNAHLHMTACNFCEIDEVRDQAIYLGRWNTEDTLCLPDRICLSEQVSEEFYRRVRAGETIVSHNTQTNPVTNAQANASIGALSFITVPFFKEGEWKYLFSIHDDVPRTWRADEIELVREVANRTFPRIDHARAEAALRHNQEMFSALVKNAPFGIYLIDVEFRLQQINRGAEAAFSNIDPLIGRDFAEIIRIVWQEPFATEAINRFRHTLATGESHYSPPIVEPRANIEEIQAYDWQIHRLTLPDGSYGVVCYFYDLSQIKRAEEMIRRTAQRDAFLVTLSDALRPLTDSVEIQAIASRILGEYLGANRVAYFEVRGSDYVVERDYANGADAVAGIYPIDAFGQSLIAAYRSGHTVVQPDVSADPSLSPDQQAAYAAIEIAAHIGIPLIKDGEFVAGLAVYMNRPRVWTQDEVTLAKEVADRTWAAVERARAEAAVAADLQDTRLLRDLSARLIGADDIQVLYDEIVTAAIALTQADSATFQILDAATQELVLLASQNFDRTITEYFHRIDSRSSTSCSNVLATGERSFVRFDVSEGDDANASLRILLDAGYLCAQSTPLISRSGKLIGMVSPHWRNYHRPSDRELRFLDLLARQAADLIEQRQAQEKIQEQAALLDVTSDAIFVRDLEYRILYWNSGAERMYGWQAAEVLGKNCHEFLYKEISPSVEEALTTVVEQGEWQGELNKIAKSGQEIIVSSRWTLIRDGAQQPKSILAVDTDITEKKQLQQQFYRAQRLESLGTLASGIAHDLNNILTPILTVAQLLLLKFPNLDRKNQQLLEILENNSKRGADLVTQITAFARGAEGKRVPLQPKHLLKEIEQIVKSTFPKSIEICINGLTPNLWTVLADPTQIHQVLMNLCVNARDAMPNGGTLSISAENFYVDENYARMNLEAKVGRYVAIAVSDTGCGMPQKVLERIFEPFFTTKEPGQGTGLGLSTVIGIVKNHSGFVNVHSKVGEGSQFQVYLKAIEKGANQQTDSSLTFRGNDELILVVDDEVSIRDITKTSLENHNYRIFTASDGIEASSIYAPHKNEISLVLMDIQMPSIDGFKAIRILRQINPSVKIIAISGLASNLELLKASSITVQAFLSKPYTLKELLNAIQDVLSSQSETA